MIKKVLMVLSAVLLLLCGCGKRKAGIKIGIVQYATAPALDRACEGIIEALADAGYKDEINIDIEKYNPEGDSSTLALIAERAIAENDLVFGIATPVVAALKGQHEKQGSDIPVLFTAVTDPVGELFMKSEKGHGGKFTGTSDLNPVEEQAKLLWELKPNAKSLGVIYTSSETNSLYQVRLLEEKCLEDGIKLEKKEISKAADLESATIFIIDKKPDAIYLPTDNTVNDNINTVIKRTNQAGIPTICGEEGMVGEGGTITYGIDYKELGRITGEMAVEILKDGKKPEDLELRRLEHFELVINEKAAKEAKIEIPESLLKKANRIIK